MLQFDEATARILEDSYHGSDFTRRRRASFDILSPRRGQTVLDLGCGNGMLTLELARAVGPEGRVIGIDSSQSMLDLAADRCRDRDNVTFHEAGADVLPLESNSIDGAVSLQVFEYIDDMTPSLLELARVLRPHAPLAIGDLHFGTWAWHSDHPERMARMMQSWNRHVASISTPARLPALMQQAGFGNIGCRASAYCDITLRPDGLPQLMIHVMRNYAIQKGHLPEADVLEWQAEQFELSRSGRFFFSLTHFVVHGIRI
ncbi:MAG: methyltransferase domain-containing protein [Rhodobacter sp.]|nr:methyltransferase domain-containing protein [Rhodobacter sp.]